MGCVSSSSIPLTQDHRTIELDRQLEEEKWEFVSLIWLLSDFWFSFSSFQTARWSSFQGFSSVLCFPLTLSPSFPITCFLSDMIAVLLWFIHAPALILDLASSSCPFSGSASVTRRWWKRQKHSGKDDLDTFVLCDFAWSHCFLLFSGQATESFVCWQGSLLRALSHAFIHPLISHLPSPSRNFPFLHLLPCLHLSSLFSSFCAFLFS